MTKHTMTSTKSFSVPVSILLTMLMVVMVRESTWLLFTSLGYPSATNIVAMLIMFVILFVWRFTYGIPKWLSEASNRLLADSGFAFLPVSAGAGLLLFTLGDELWGFIITIVVSTLLPLWGLAKLTQLWFSHHNDANKAQNK